MKTIDATLPALGSYSIPFYAESQEVLDYIGKGELERLDQVQHLGIASKVFTGVNHSRLEYLLLQCAVINLLPKFHNGKESLALSAKVYIPGQNTKVSSGEELLKCWAILSNVGHAQFTFGVEVSLLNYAREHQSFVTILTQGLPAKLRSWVKETIDGYRTTQFHFALTLYRISNLPSGSRIKFRLFRLLSALLLPLDNTDFPSNSDHFKLFRLKELYSRVRLLSIVSLDSYHSHHPIRFQIPTALMNLDSLFDKIGDKSVFIQLMEQTAAWLADEIYMHPKAAAAQKNYEISSKRKLETRYKPRLSTADEFQEFYPNLMNNGFGKVQLGSLSNLSRLTFPNWGVGAVFGKDLYEFSTFLEKRLSREKTTHVSVLLNPYSEVIHIDLLYENEVASNSDISSLCYRTTEWILRLIEAQMLRRLRSMRFPSTWDEARRRQMESRMRARYLPDFLDPAQEAMRSLFIGIINYVLPSHYTGSMAEVLPQKDIDSIGLKFRMIDNTQHNSVAPNLENTISLLSSNLNCDEDRVHEIRTLQQFSSRSKALVLATCHEKFIIRDESEKCIDEWDGISIEIFQDKLVLSIIEAKNTKPKSRRADSAFAQLQETKRIINMRRPTTSRRKRIPNYGAVISFTL